LAYFGLATNKPAKSNLNKFKQISDFPDAKNKERIQINVIIIFTHHSKLPTPCSLLNPQP